MRTENNSPAVGCFFFVFALSFIVSCVTVAVATRNGLSGSSRITSYDSYEIDF